MAKKTIPQKIKKLVRDYVVHLKKEGLPIEKVILYGSWAKGKAHRWSDIDVCVISLALRRKKDPLAFLWKTKRKKDIQAMISPVGYHPKDFVDESPLVWEIKKYGVEIPIRETEKQNL